MRLAKAVRRWGPFASHGGIVLLVAVLMVIRAILLDGRLRPLSACRGCMALLTLQHDAAVLGAILVAMALSRLLAKWRVLRYALKALICLIVLAYSLDLLVIFLYNIRLVVEDFLKYGLEVGGVFTIAKQMVRTLAGVVGLLVALGVVTLMVAFMGTGLGLRRRRAGAFLVAGGALFAIGLIPTRQVFAHSWAYRNVFAINLDRAILASYSRSFADSLLATHGDLRVGEVCSPRPTAAPNVVMVVLEGFSSYHSRFFSGFGDLTPNLDRIASEHTAFTSFWANGFTTENGLISLLGGELPIPGSGQMVFRGGFAFAGFSDLPRSLPRQFRAQGYRTAFLTTGDLSFSGKGAWLKELGFDELIGHADAFYDGWPRLHFSAAPDSALYLRALGWLEGVPRDRPFFLVVESVSSHFPFIEPDTRVKSEDAVFRYADRQLGYFYDSLNAHRVLDSVLFVVASDHRTMDPLRPDEVERFGEEARALVPFVVSDPDRPEARRVEDRFQQVDLATSIEAMLTGRSCPTSVRGDLLSEPPIPPGCVFHARAEDRGRIDVVCGGDEAAIRLRGDHTRVESGRLPNERLIVDQINYERLERRARARGGRN